MLPLYDSQGLRITATVTVLPRPLVALVAVPA